MCKIHSCLRSTTNKIENETKNLRIKKNMLLLYNHLTLRITKNGKTKTLIHILTECCLFIQMNCKLYSCSV